MSQTYEAYDRYVLLERVAAGGMAEVFLAKSIGVGGIEKFIAIKRILPQYSDHPEFIEMFKEEANIAINLDHGNVVSILDFGIEKQQFFIVMEFVEGQNLRQSLNHLKKENREFSIDQIVYIIKEVSSGLDHAHRCLDKKTGRPLNIIHRDMSPQNVMVSFEGEIKIVDFGIAKAETQMENTRTGTIKGKFGYMSPEQAEGLPVDLRTDIFSLGIILWELLAKERLFQAQSESATLKKIRDCNVPTLRKVNPAIPMELERICNKALAKDKSLRYQSSNDLHKDLNRFLNTQYPDFSAREFSVFMKSIYSQMFLENRKKLADFAKIQVTPAENTRTHRINNTDTSANPESLLIDNPSTSSMQTNDSRNSDLVASLSANAGHKVENTLSIIKEHSKIVKISDLKTQNETIPAEVRIKIARQAERSNTMTGSISNKTKTNLKIKRVPDSMDSTSWMWMATFIILFMAGAFYVYQSHELLSSKVIAIFKKTPKECVGEACKSIGKIDIASKGLGDKKNNPPQNQNNRPNPTNPNPPVSANLTPKVPIVIKSRPLGATVAINGQTVGTTPYLGAIEANVSFRVTLSRQGFVNYEIPNAIVDSQSIKGYTMEATLQPEPPKGYVDIKISSGGGENPVIYVNGIRLTEKPPINRYAVPAGVPIKIRAINPFTQVEAEEVTTVEVDQRKVIDLILGRRASETN